MKIYRLAFVWQPKKCKPDINFVTIKFFYFTLSSYRVSLHGYEVI